MDSKSINLSPREEGELEDGEICDDDTEEKVFAQQQGKKRPCSMNNSNFSRNTRKSKQPARTLLPVVGSQPTDFRLLIPYNRGPHSHSSSFTANHRQQGGPSGPDRPPLGPRCDQSPRSSFWERSHTALDRLRHRGKLDDGRGDWGRGGWGDGCGGGREAGRPPTGRYGPGENHSNKRESPSRNKQKVMMGRNQVRNQQMMHNNNVAKVENGLDESFEDLLTKYKQIQLELECIRKEENLVLKPKDLPAQNESEVSASIPQTEPLLDANSIPNEAAAEDLPGPEKTEEKRGFQAFNLKPLRQKLLTPAEIDALKTKTEKKDSEKEDSDMEKGQLESGLSGPPLVSLQPEVKGSNEDEDLSELQLRLLALQSASRKWQQKEQQVMKESKDKITKAKPSQEKSSSTSSSAAKQAFRKQQLRTWKLQQERDQEEQRRQEEEERRRREEEIRKIRDLSNQDEQYNRFMKLVGGSKPPRNRSKDRDHTRKSSGKQGLDTSGNLYQYDNYDEVAMDTDSETNSPGEQPAHLPMHSLMVRSTPNSKQGLFYASLKGVTNKLPLSFQDLGQLRFLSVIPSAPPPPLPPMPPPPDELEPPPKPPFADEEEEEEMLLRETCLMSMANKKVPLPESVPIHHNGQFKSYVLLFPQLPRHKAVVVQLNGSDDSDSDMEACSSSTQTQSVFGGLEFMIKEARRNAEAAKPKPTSGPEKENKPGRTPEALSEEKKTEYQLLKEEIASREKQKILKDHSPQGVPSPAGSDPDVDFAAKAAVELQLTEAETRLTKHGNLLLKDEAILRQLLQQEQKKEEALKAAEAKVAKVKEQLLASEKIVSANKTLLNRLQEQVHRVQHRVSVKKNHSLKLEEVLVQAQAAFSKASFCPPSILQPVKRLCVEVSVAPRGSERHFADLLAQKQRLQQLESEYALKIQKLKEAQALHNRGAVPEPPLPQATSTPLPRARHPSIPPTSPFPLPQPSLHDLTQDKLTLVSSEDPTETEESDLEPAATARPSAQSVRRRSFRETGSFTKPKLDSGGTGLVKDSPAKPVMVKASGPGELFLGLEVEALQRRDQQQARLGELLLGELRVISEDVDTMAAQSGHAELKPVPFGPYRSPLLVFKSYRFSPYFRTKEKLSLSSVSYSNVVAPKKCFCRFDLTGTCNDDDCQWQHMRNCTFGGNQLFQDILSYNLALIGCSESSTSDVINVATEKYIKQLFGANNDRMGMDQKAVLLVSKVNESKRHVPPFTTCKDLRRWRPQPAYQASPNTGDDSWDESRDTGPVKYGENCLSATLDVCVTPDDKRYFISETDDISNLETSVLESPRNAQLWIKLAFKYLSQKECLDASLNTLSRALEDNRDNPEIWCYYLSLFSRRGKRDEVQEMCEMAVEHAPDYQVWWSYLTTESLFEGKDYVCGRLLQYLLDCVGTSGLSERLSFQLLESLLYRVQLSVFTGRLQNALAILQNALKSVTERCIADYLTISDRCLVWLSFIHLTEFDRLPASLYDPANSNPSRVVSIEAFALPWRTPLDVRTEPDTLIAVFEDALRQCTDQTLPPSERTLACLPLHTNLITTYSLLGRYDAGLELCESLLALCPHSCALLDALSGLYVGKGDGEQGVGVWLRALSQCPHNAEVFYHTCKFLMAQVSLPVSGLYNISFFGVLSCSLWQWVHGNVGEAMDAFERALGAVMPLDVLHKLWLDYLLFTSSKLAGSPSNSRELRVLSDLVQRCLVTVPSRLEVPFSSAQYWSCFRFHNKVVSHYLSCLPHTQHPHVLERLRYTMPTNAELALRLLHQEWQDGNIEHLKFQARMLSSSVPNCLVRLLYQQALQNLPLCATLWKDRLLFEAAEGGKTDKLRKLVDKCQEVGVSLSEPLNLCSSKTEGEEH
uniref:Putative zinc-finger domain-containing protein n=1 Tax=Oncorhynchus tshawytscha TaxID=74940 RepID=A0A8C8D6E1_ONCTS